MDEEQIIEVYSKGITEVISLVKNMGSNLSSEIGALNSHITGLNTEITGLNGQITELKVENNKLNARLAELEVRINKNSSNSSKPPSSDGFKKKPRNSREKTDKHTGGQIGHKGSTLEKVEKPDKVIDVNSCTCDCGHTSNNSQEIRCISRQVFDIPIIKVAVTEYRVYEWICPKCGKLHRAKFPANVTQPVQYGENLQALMTYLTSYQLIPLNRAAETISDLCGHKISEGTLVNVNNRLHARLADFENTIKDQLKASEVVHFDETGLRCNGKIHWLHSASNEFLTHYAVHKNRGSVAPKEIGIIPEFDGTAVHDHWMSYYTFTNCSHSECNAHNLRNLKGVYEDFGYSWAKNMAELLVSIKRHVDNLKAEGKLAMPAGDIDAYNMKYKSIIADGHLEAPVPINAKTGKPKRNAGHILIRRLEEFDIETLSFMYDFRIPFDNNQAERDIRMPKLRQKISGSFRGADGPKMFCRIRGYISTCRKNGLKVMGSLMSAAKGNPFIPQTHS